MITEINLEHSRSELHRTYIKQGLFQVSFSSRLRKMAISSLEYLIMCVVVMSVALALYAISETLLVIIFFLGLVAAAIHQAMVFADQIGVRSYSNFDESRSLRKLINLNYIYQGIDHRPLSFIMDETDNLKASGATSDKSTPTEVRPTLPLLKLFLFLILIIIVIATIALELIFLVWMGRSFSHSGGASKSIIILLAVPIFEVFVGIKLIGRLSNKSADHLTEYDPRSPILYLRSFDSDLDTIKLLSTSGDDVKFNFEETILDIVKFMGPIVALGTKRDIVPPKGAARAYKDHSVWQARVEKWLSQAELVVMKIGPGTGFDWELKKIIEEKKIGNTIFVFPPFDCSSMLGRSRLKNEIDKWSNFREIFRGTEFYEELSHVNISDTLVFFMKPGRHIFTISSNRRDAQDYDLAMRLAIYIKKAKQTKVIPTGSLGNYGFQYKISYKPQ